MQAAQSLRDTEAGAEPIRGSFLLGMVIWKMILLEPRCEI